MKKLAILAISTGAFALLFTTVVPQPADAGWRRKAVRHGYYVPRARVYVAPRYGYYTPRRCKRTRYGCGAYPYAYYPYWRKQTWGGWY